VRVDHLIAKGSIGQVGSLGDVEDFFYRRLSEVAGLSWPELTKDSEERRFSAAVGARDKHVHARFNLKAHLGHKYVAVGAQNRDVLKNDIVRDENLSTLGSLLENLGLVLLLLVIFLNCIVLCHHHSLVLALAQILEHLVHLVDQGRVTSQVLNLLVGDNQAADSLSEVDQKRRVAYVILCDLSLIIAILGEVRSALGAEDGQADNGVANHNSAVLDEH